LEQNNSPAGLVAPQDAQTWLPANTSVVMIMLDQQDPTAATEGDLAIAATGAKLAAVPVRVGGGRRLALLYDVAALEPGSRLIGISVASATGWRLAGVVAMPAHQRAQLVQNRRPLPARAPQIPGLHLLGDHPATRHVQPHPGSHPGGHLQMSVGVPSRTPAQA